MLGKFISSLRDAVAVFMRFSRKRILRLLTGEGELERILRGGTFSSTMLHAFISELQRSRVVQKTLVDAVLGGDRGDDSIEALALRILALKRVKADRPAFRSRVLPNLLQCIQAACSAVAMYNAARMAAAQPYDASVVVHEELLAALWSAMQPGVTMPARRGKHWQVIGFQGDDPATDFRAGGVLALRVYLQLATQHGDTARDITRRTELPYKGYPLALVCISNTSWALQLAKERRLHAYFASLPKDTATDDVVAPVIACAVHLTLLFNDVWWSPTIPRPSSLMDYPRVEAIFRQRVLSCLEGTGLLPPLPRSTLLPEPLSRNSRSAAGGVTSAGSDASH